MEAAERLKVTSHRTGSGELEETSTLRSQWLSGPPPLDQSWSYTTSATHPTAGSSGVRQVRNGRSVMFAVVGSGHVSIVASAAARVLSLVGGASVTSPPPAGASAVIREVAPAACSHSSSGRPP